MEQLFGGTMSMTAFILLAIWSLPWKGVALWKAARASDKKWFIALLVVNTIGILDILYIYVFSKRKQEEKQPVIDVASA